MIVQLILLRWESRYIPVLPDPGEELFSSLLEERTPPDVFSDLSTVLLSMDLVKGWRGWRRSAEEEKDRKTEKRRGKQKEKKKGEREYRK